MIQDDYEKVPDQLAGSPKSSEPVFVIIGKLRRPHGLHGEMIMEIHTDYPERFSVGKTIRVGHQQTPMVIRSIRPHKEFKLIAFEGYNTSDDLGGFRNQYVYIDTKEIPDLPAGDYYHHQLIGLQVISESEQQIGTVVEILVTGANDVLVVQQNDNKEVLLPFVDDYLIEVNLNIGYLKMRILPGLVSNS
ncbi:MAG: 16S rRNA processing protein RimM [Anaerolineales bacterium]|nr:16S rRNA processing protein RimM [Anaerolineales bacterium]